MHIEDDIKLHSHLLGDIIEKEKVLRERQHDMREIQLSQSHTIKTNSENIMGTLEIQKQCQDAIFEMRAEIKVMRGEKRGWQMAIEGLRNPKHWIPIIGLILLIESIKGLEVAKLIRYYTGI